MKAPLFVLFALLILVGLAPAALAFNVTPNGFTSYIVDGVSNPTLNLTRGTTYTFNVNASGHPFYIKTVPNSTGTGSVWDLGVTGNGVTVGTLTFTVPSNAPNQLFYHCSVHSAMGGTINIQGTVGVGDPAPSVAWLGRAIPNPTAHGASFRVGLPREAKVEVVLFDARGRKIRTLWNGSMPAGEQTVGWNGQDQSGHQAPSGAYYYRVRVEGRTLTGRLTVAR